MILRPARPLDAGMLGAILSEFVATTDWLPQVHSGAEDIAHAGEMIDRGWVTVAGGRKPRAFLARDGEHVHALYVAIAARGLGYGSALLAQAKLETERLALWTFQNNARAIDFYKKRGFLEKERTGGEGNAERLPDVYLVWNKREAR